MSNQHLEAVISELSARVTSQGIQIAELQKQLTDMQAKVSCDAFSIKEGEIFIEKKAISEPLLSQLTS
ncbi:hypothetical protein AB7W88_20435 [Providencia vermicola]|uniref:Uncharacterized protein n=2 Tax=Providencia stuartii TaxID=588 RepID=A0ABD5L9B9_PROST|nr:MULTISPECIES: hypothetical protein [Providencia]ELR5044678.1 hypothetical protein [Providencia rettgeri]APG50236.1 hypothetical protein BGK56_04425 [Providencia stuartii]MCR4081130.1 hypothetical protein [Providencia stuartii]MDT2041119.1 hypothetical protein [Providencia stuartii]QPN39445.1 hypothetical protein I3B46_15085 [Providencia sp. 2.29]